MSIFAAIDNRRGRDLYHDARGCKSRSNLILVRGTDEETLALGECR